MGSRSLSYFFKIGPEKSTVNRHRPGANRARLDKAVRQCNG